MPLSLDENHAQFQIKSYKPGIIRINDKIYTRNLIISPFELIENWEVQSAQDITAESLAVIHSLKPDILLIGTGSTQFFVPLKHYGELINLKIGVEMMDTAAACRTFNALCSENRRVMAALILK